MAAGNERLGGLPEYVENRPLSRRGLYIHTKRKSHNVAARGHVGRFCVCDTQRGWPHLRWREDQRAYGSVEDEAQEWRHCRNRYPAWTQAQPRLALLRQDIARA